MTEPSLLSVERRGAVAVVRHDHPPRNFLTVRFLHELRVCLAGLERDPAVRVIVLAGAHDGHFGLHLEIDEIRALLGMVPPLPRPLFHVAALVLRAVAWLAARSPLAARVLVPSGVRGAMLNVLLAFGALERSAKVTIAAINGPCLGGALEMALACDHRIMIDDASFRIGLPEILCGLVPGFGGTQRLARVLGADRALRLLLGAELLTPRAAEREGLVGRALPPERFWDEVMGLAERLGRRSPAAIAAMKRAVRGGSATSLGRGLALEAREVMGIARTARAGIDAYAEILRAELARPTGEQRTVAELAELMQETSHAA